MHRRHLHLALVVMVAAAMMPAGIASAALWSTNPVLSPSHPNPNTWYPDPDVELTWPGLPREVGRWGADTGGEYRGIHVTGDVAWASGGPTGDLVALDVSNPSNPTTIGAHAPGGWIGDAELAGDALYVARGYGGVGAIDVTDPTSMSTLDIENTTGFVRRVEVDGETLFAAAQTEGLILYDVSDPSNFSHLITIPTSDTVYDVQPQGDVLYVAEGNVGVRTWDISNPTSPTILDTFDTTDAWAVDVQGDVAYVADRTTVRILDVSDPSSISQITFASGVTTARDVDVFGDRMYVADWTSGYDFFDVSDPASPVRIGGGDPLDEINGLFVTGDHVYLADGTEGIRVFGMMEPGQPMGGTAYVPGSGSMRDADAEGDVLYACNASQGMDILDISEPGTPTLLANYDTTHSVVGVDVEGDTAYVAAWNTGLTVVDVSNPSAPSEIGWFNTDGTALDVAVEGDTGYIADGSQGLIVVDVSDPSAPTTLGVDDPATGSAQRLDVQGEYAYVAGWNAGLWVYDVSNPAAPSRVATFTTTDDASDVAVYGDTAYVTIGTDGLQILDVEDPTSPTSLSTLDLASFSRGPVLVGDLLLLANGSSGMLVIDVEDPTTPETIWQYDTTDYAYRVVAHGEWAYVLDDEDGVMPVDYGLYPTGYSWVLDADVDTTPDVVSEGAETTATIADLTPRQWWFHVRGTDGEQGGVTWHRKIRVASDGTSYTTLAGDNRYETAIDISQAAYGASTVTTVIVATGENWPDALGGAALAGAVDGPILLTDPAAISNAVLNEIGRLGATDAYILGGEGAVSPAVQAALNGALSGTVHRLGGDNRYETANLIAAEAVQHVGGSFGGVAFVGTGENFPDALAASPLSASQVWPLYLAEPDGLSSATKTAMNNAGVTSALILGGTGVVSSGVQTYLEGKYGAGSVERLSGDNRYETAVDIASYGVAQAGLVWNGLAIATGDNFPDALAGGALQAGNGSVLLLTDPDTLSTATQVILTNRKHLIADVTYLGGTGAVSQTVRDSVSAVLY